MSEHKNLKFFYAGDRLMGAIDNNKEQPVRLRKLRPYDPSLPAFSVVNLKGEELALVMDPAALDDPSRRSCEMELEKVYASTVIEAILKVGVERNARSLTLRLSGGERRILIRDPNISVKQQGSDSYIIKDVAGNRYSIKNLSQMDKKTKDCMGMIL